jgi:hypothetical protein
MRVFYQIISPQLINDTKKIKERFCNGFRGYCKIGIREKWITKGGIKLLKAGITGKNLIFR